ncbi:MAG: DUF2281 domain-containing protein [Oscillatoria sp. SIO1A7]|nr:DUF2281 domain-containing protein [Oscillatoria sp. SIO1A7]
MKGIQFVVDDAGEKRAVLIDLAEWGDLWEDFYDIIVARNRQDEEDLSWQELKKEIPRPLLFGSDKGRIYMSDDFDEPLDDFQQHIAFLK